MQRVDNSTYTVTEAMVDSSSTNRLNIVCMINNIPNILGFSNMNINRVNKNGNVENMARMQSLYDTLPGYQRPALVQSSATMQAVGVYSVKNPTLGISVPVASLTCNEGLQYNCSLAYDDKQGSTAVTKTSTVVRNLTVSGTLFMFHVLLEVFSAFPGPSINQICGGISAAVPHLKSILFSTFVGKNSP
ncbi:hypothetical protein DPMN_144204 [Dreissena polymorpha]|uniref:Uncharacterized protein n=1 Tax=Dreissena polymorpha TaxID=45954 RepID=A0A9D4JNY7_DREPO|nr:hypothetical protein DPMN_144204 [Dreissena polymorpha]